MIEGYKTVTEVAEEWGISARRVRAMCSAGKIEGASKLCQEWAIPFDAKRPTDGRITTGQYINWRGSKEEKK